MPSFKNYIEKPNNTLTVTSNGTYDVIRKSSVVVNVNTNYACVAFTSNSGATLTVGSYSYTLGSAETLHYFIIPQGVYTCTAKKVQPPKVQQCQLHLQLYLVLH